MKKSIGLSVGVLVAVLATGAYALQSGQTVPNETTTTVQMTALQKQNQFVKDDTTQVLVDKEVKKEDVVKVVQHGDHWHVHTRDGREFITYTNPNTQESIDIVSVVTLDQLRGMDVVSIEVHGDHWHVHTRDGNEYITYSDPSRLFNNVSINSHVPSPTPAPHRGGTPSQNLDVVRIAKHGNHYHLYTRDGKESVVYSDPRPLYPHAEYVEYDGSHHGDTQKTPVLAKKHGDHWHLYADLDGKEEIGSTHDDPRVKYPGIKVIEDDHHEDDHHGDTHKNPVLAKKHGDHWHLYADLDGKEEIGSTHDDPRVKYPGIKVIEDDDHGDDHHGDTQKTPVLAKKHGNHWHLYADLDGKEEIGSTHDDPRVKYPGIKVIEEDDHGDDHHGDTQKTPVLAKKHGNHWHLYADLDGKEEIGSTHDDPRVKYPGIKVIEDDDHGDDHHADLKNVINPANYDEETKQKVAYLADAFGVLATAIKVVQAPAGLIAKVPHDDHYHDYRLSDIDLTKTIEEDEHLIDLKKDYIAFVYGVKKEAIRVSDKNFAFNEPTHDYDPTHIHPYVIPRHLVNIPKVTGDAEIDFENELLEVAKQTGMNPTKIKVQKNQFVIPHTGHNHYLNIKAIDGIEEYMKNRLPEIKGSYVAGQTDKAVVLNVVSEIEASMDGADLTAKEKHRIQRALNEFKFSMEELITNSTQGYTDALRAFQDTYIFKKEDVTPSINQPVQDKYNAVVERLKNTNLKEIHVDKEATLKQLHDAVLANNMSEIVKIDYTLKELKRFQDRHVATEAQYLDFFMQNIEKDTLPHELREKVADLSRRLYNIAMGMGYENTATFFKEVIDTKIAVDLANAKGQTYPKQFGNNYAMLMYQSLEILSFVNGWRPNFIGDMTLPKEILQP